jgi:fatty-acyl-CoA synthase
MSHPHNRQTLGDLLRRSARRLPHKLAIRCGSTDWSFAELDRVADRFAAGLAGLNVQLGDRVAVLARNSHAFVALRFALARLGAVIVPINYMLNAGEVKYILDHAGASLLCVDTEMAAVGAEAAQGTAVRELVWLPGEGPSEPVPGLKRFDELQPDAAPPARELDARMLLQIIYTSGTESAPKGAMLTHEAVMAEYVTCLVDAEVHEGDCLLHALPLYHCAQLDVFLGPAVYVGASSVITAKPTPENLLALMAANGINSFFAPPTVWISLLRSPLFDAADLSRLAKGYYGASIMPVEVLKELLTRAPRLRLWNLYGQTEIAPVATVLKPEDQMRKAGSAGKPALNVETRLVDDDMKSCTARRSC